MTQTIEQITDFSAIEDAIESWLETASGLGDLTAAKDDKGNSLPMVRWAGYNLPRKRPYALITIISQPSQGQPWSTQAKTTSYMETTYYQPFRWNCQISLYTDSYDEDGAANRTTAYRLAQNVLNRAFLIPVKRVLDNVGIAYNPTSQNISPGVLQEEDKWLQEARIEFSFWGVAETKLKDSDWFESITVPTEENGRLHLS